MTDDLRNVILEIFKEHLYATTRDGHATCDCGMPLKWGNDEDIRTALHKHVSVEVFDVVDMWVKNQLVAGMMPIALLHHKTRRTHLVTGEPTVEVCADDHQPWPCRTMKELHYGPQRAMLQVRRTAIYHCKTALGPPNWRTRDAHAAIQRLIDAVNQELTEAIELGQPKEELSD